MDSESPYQSPYQSSEILKLTSSGIWLADGKEISHEPTRKLFARSLKRQGAGYMIQVGRESKPVEVEDTAYFIHRVDGNPAEGFEAWLSDDTREKLDPATLRYRPGRLICKMERNGVLEEVKFLHAAYFDFMKFLREDDFNYFLDTKEGKFVLARKQI
jgi:hypothetical protein